MGSFCKIGLRWQWSLRTASRLRPEASARQGVERHSSVVLRQVFGKEGQFLVGSGLYLVCNLAEWLDMDPASPVDGGFDEASLPPCLSNISAHFSCTGH